MRGNVKSLQELALERAYGVDANPIVYIQAFDKGEMPRSVFIGLVVKAIPKDTMVDYLCDAIRVHKNTSAVAAGFDKMMKMYSFLIREVNLRAINDVERFVKLGIVKQDEAFNQFVSFKKCYEAANMEYIRHYDALVKEFTKEKAQLVPLASQVVKERLRFSLSASTFENAFNGSPQLGNVADGIAEEILDSEFLLEHTFDFINCQNRLVRLIGRTDLLTSSWEQFPNPGV
jgi:hypothetical protein